jgi:hypothetical protein
MLVHAFGTEELLIAEAIGVAHRSCNELSAHHVDVERVGTLQSVTWIT